MTYSTTKFTDILNDFISFITPEFNKNLKAIKVKSSNRNPIKK